MLLPLQIVWNDSFMGHSIPSWIRSQRPDVSLASCCFNCSLYVQDGDKILINGEANSTGTAQLLMNSVILCSEMGSLSASSFPAL